MKKNYEKPPLTLDEIWQSIEQQLTRAVNDRKHPFRLPVMATANENIPNMRIVVLRKVGTSSLTLTAYTDIRSKKIGEIRQNPNITWLFWHPRQQIQIKAYGTVQIEHHTERTQQIWENMHFGAKATYLAAAPPSSSAPIPTSGLPDDFSEEKADHYVADNFCILESRITKVEWLRLDILEHRRAEFELLDGSWKSGWLIP